MGFAPLNPSYAATIELRGSLAVEEISEAFARVAGEQPSCARLFLVVVALAPAHTDLLVQQALEALYHPRVVLGDHLPDLDAGISEARRRDDLVEETNALRLIGGDNANGIEQLLRLWQT